MAETENERKGAPSAAGVSIEDAKAALGDLVMRAFYGDERIILTRYGKPIAAVVGLRDLATLEEGEAA